MSPDATPDTAPEQATPDTAPEQALVQGETAENSSTLASIALRLAESQSQTNRHLGDLQSQTNQVIINSERKFDRSFRLELVIASATGLIALATVLTLAWSVTQARQNSDLLMSLAQKMADSTGAAGMHVTEGIREAAENAGESIERLAPNPPLNLQEIRTDCGTSSIQERRISLTRPRECGDIVFSIMNPRTESVTVEPTLWVTGQYNLECSSTPTTSLLDANEDRTFSFPVSECLLRDFPSDFGGPAEAYIRF